MESFNITAVIVLRGLATKGDKLLIGVQINEQAVGWGECDGIFSSTPIRYNMITATHTIQKIVAPALKKRPFTNLREILTRLDGLTEQVSQITTIEPKQKSSGVSRRGILTGQFASSAQPQPTRQETFEKRPLPCVMRFAISHAILNAFANATQQHPAKLLADGFELGRLKTAVSILLPVTDQSINTARSILTPHVSSLGYHTGTTNAVKNLGPQAGKLQTFVSQIAEWIPSLKPNYTPTIHLNLQGAFTALFGPSNGQILNAINRLHRGAKPFQLTLENINHYSERVDVVEQFKKLMELMRKRENRAKLIAGNTHYAQEDIEALIHEKAVDGVHLNIEKTGSLHESITLIQACQEAEIEVILMSDTNGRFQETAVHLAVATGANQVSGSPDHIFNELQRLKWAAR